MKGSDLMLIGGLCLGGYFLWKYLSGGDWDLPAFGGAGAGGFLGGSDQTPSTDPGITGGNTLLGGGGSRAAVAVPSPSQSWTNVTYGDPGQPSVTFLANTLDAAKQPNASQATKNAAAAAYAGAPPRVVAKIKAGKIF